MWYVISRAASYSTHEVLPLSVIFVLVSIKFITYSLTPVTQSSPLTGIACFAKYRGDIHN